MNQLIEQFRNQLLQINIFANDTIQNYVACIYRFVEFLNQQGQLNPLAVQPAQLRQWLGQLKHANTSNSRLIHHQSALKHFYTFLQNMKLTTHNPTSGFFPIRKVMSEKNQPISQEAAFQLLRSIDRSSWIGERNFMIISVLWALGLRREELVTLKIRDFESNHDPSNKIGLLRIHGKGQKQRALFVVDKLYDNLLNYLALPQSPKRKQAPIFPNKQGKIITGDHVLKIVHQAAQKAGITQHLTPHVLRHSFATEMYLQQVPLEAIEAMMGHESEAETAVYIHIPDALKQQALEQLTLQGDVSWPSLRYRQ